MVHPVVRPDRNEALRLVQHFNDQLRKEGWQLVEEERIAGRPRFVAQLMRNSGGRSVSRAKSVADALDAGWMQKEIARLENAVDRDPALAIGTAKELSPIRQQSRRHCRKWSPKAEYRSTRAKQSLRKPCSS
ncbi:hypothetical protein [Rhizobium sp. LjRoot258]|uniref:AbiJ-related protein n=1 Tax=Rhizobium sp. LjRoot258 TaxID=3342299 RepID=UPI003F50C32F